MKLFLEIQRENYTLTSAFYGNEWINDLFPQVIHVTLLYSDR